MSKLVAQTLVILTPGFPANEDDSTCVPPQQIFVKALKDIAPDLNIIVLTFQYPFFSKRYSWNGAEVVSFGDPKNRRLPRAFVGFRVRKELRSIIKQHNVLGLLSFWAGKYAWVGHTFAAKHDLKHLSWLLGQDAKVDNKYLPKFNPQPDSLIAISDFVADACERNHGVRPANVIPVGVNPQLFRNSSERDIDILGAGSLIPLKQYDVFINVIEQLVKDMPSVKAAICGDGPEMKKLRSLIKEKQLENNMQLTGRCDHGQVLRYMERSKVFLHPSNYEGFSTVCLEALYAGNQVVSFIKPMHFDIENWTIVDNAEQMAAFVKAVHQNNDLKHQSVLPYDVHDNAKKMLELFEYRIGN